MVSLDDVKSSNTRIASSLPEGPVAVFVGGTSGIGEYTLKAFAKYTRKPRVYFVGRSQAAADRIKAECTALNPGGAYTFLQADTSLLRNVDSVCRELRSKEQAINLLVLSTGTLSAGKETDEGLYTTCALVTYTRTRFVENLLPALQRATGLRRVLSIFAACKEGPINLADIQGRSVPLSKMIASRGHVASIVTLSLEVLARRAPDVAFIHDFPGPVRSNILRDNKGPVMAVVKGLSKILAPLFFIPNDESGERHLFLATSARYPPAKKADSAAGVPIEGGGAVAKGTTGVAGSGVYCIDEKCESADQKVVELLEGLRKEGMVEKVWEDHEKEVKRITGSLELAA